MASLRLRFKSASSIFSKLLIALYILLIPQIHLVSIFTYIVNLIRNHCKGSVKIVNGKEKRTFSLPLMLCGGLLPGYCERRYGSLNEK